MKNVACSLFFLLLSGIFTEISFAETQANDASNTLRYNTMSVIDFDYYTWLHYVGTKDGKKRRFLFNAAHCVSDETFESTFAKDENHDADKAACDKYSKERCEIIKDW